MLGRIATKEKVEPGRSSESVSVTVITGRGRGVRAEYAHHNHVVVAGCGDSCDSWKSCGGRGGGGGRETPHVVEGVVLEGGGGSGEERVGG